MNKESIEFTGTSDPVSDNRSLHNVPSSTSTVPNQLDDCAQTNDQLQEHNDDTSSTSAPIMEHNVCDNQTFPSYQQVVSWNFASNGQRNIPHGESNGQVNCVSIPFEESYVNGYETVSASQQLSSHNFGGNGQRNDNHGEQNGQARTLPLSIGADYASGYQRVSPNHQLASKYIDGHGQGNDVGGPYIQARSVSAPIEACYISGYRTLPFYHQHVGSWSFGRNDQECALGEPNIQTRSVAAPIGASSIGGYQTVVGNSRGNDLGKHNIQTRSISASVGASHTSGYQTVPSHHKLLPTYMNGNDLDHHNSHARSIAAPIDKRSACGYQTVPSYHHITPYNSHARSVAVPVGASYTSGYQNVPFYRQLDGNVQGNDFGQLNINSRYGSVPIEASYNSGYQTVPSSHQLFPMYIEGNDLEEHNSHARSVVAPIDARYASRYQPVPSYHQLAPMYIDGNDKRNDLGEHNSYESSVTEPIVTTFTSGYQTVPSSQWLPRGNIDSSGPESHIVRYSGQARSISIPLGASYQSVNFGLGNDLAEPKSHAIMPLKRSASTPIEPNYSRGNETVFSYHQFVQSYTDGNGHGNDLWNHKTRARSASAPIGSIYTRGCQNVSYYHQSAPRYIDHGYELGEHASRARSVAVPVKANYSSGYQTAPAYHYFAPSNSDGNYQENDLGQLNVQTRSVSGPFESSYIGGNQTVPSYHQPAPGYIDSNGQGNEFGEHNIHTMMSLECSVSAPSEASYTSSYQTVPSNHQLALNYTHGNGRGYDFGAHKLHARSVSGSTEASYARCYETFPSFEQLSPGNIESNTQENDFEKHNDQTGTISMPIGVGYVNGYQKVPCYPQLAPINVDGNGLGEYNVEASSIWASISKSCVSGYQTVPSYRQIASSSLGKNYHRNELEQHNGHVIMSNERSASASVDPKSSHWQQQAADVNKREALPELDGLVPNIKSQCQSDSTCVESNQHLSALSNCERSSAQKQLIEIIKIEHIPEVDQNLSRENELQLQSYEIEKNSQSRNANEDLVGMVDTDNQICSPAVSDNGCQTSFKSSFLISKNLIPLDDFGCGTEQPHLMETTEIGIQSAQMINSDEPKSSEMADTDGQYQSNDITSDDIPKSEHLGSNANSSDQPHLMETFRGLQSAQNINSDEPKSLERVDTGGQYKGNDVTSSKVSNSEHLGRYAHGSDQPHLMETTEIGLQSAQMINSVKPKSLEMAETDGQHKANDTTSDDIPKSELLERNASGSDQPHLMETTAIGFQFIQSNNPLDPNSLEMTDNDGHYQETDSTSSDHSKSEDYVLNVIDFSLIECNGFLGISSTCQDTDPIDISIQKKCLDIEKQVSNIMNQDHSKHSLCQVCGLLFDSIDLMGNHYVKCCKGIKESFRFYDSIYTQNNRILVHSRETSNNVNEDNMTTWYDLDNDILFTIKDDLESLENEQHIQIPGNTFLKQLYKCSLCPFRAWTACWFHQHMKIHFPCVDKFECTACFFSSKWLLEVVDHIHVEQVDTQSHCNAKFRPLSSFIPTCYDSNKEITSDPFTICENISDFMPTSRNIVKELDALSNEHSNVIASEGNSLDNICEMDVNQNMNSESPMNMSVESAHDEMEVDDSELMIFEPPTRILLKHPKKKAKSKRKKKPPKMNFKCGYCGFEGKFKRDISLHCIDAHESNTFIKEILTEKVIAFQADI